MDFEFHSYKNALEIIDSSNHLTAIWDEICNILDTISDDDLRDFFMRKGGKSKSLSKTISELVSSKLIISNWEKSKPLYNNNTYYDIKRFSIDFYKQNVGVEIAFNHESTCAWKLLKTTLASEPSLLDKNIDTKLSIIITVNNKMKGLGGFDGSIGSYEKYIEYLPPLSNQLNCPLIIIGIQPIKEFKIAHKKLVDNKVGIVRNNINYRESDKNEF